MHDSFSTSRKNFVEDAIVVFSESYGRRKSLARALHKPFPKQ